MNGLRARLPFWATLAGTVLIAMIPTVASAGIRDVAFTFLTVAILAQAWNIIGGFGGQFSLGNSAFVGFGAYLTAWLLTYTPLPPWAAPVIAVVAILPLAALAAFALLRLHGVYFSVGTLALALAAMSWMQNWTLTGATQGMNIPFDRSLPDVVIYLLAVALAVLATLVAWYVSTSDFGLSLQAVRDDEEAAISVGVDAFGTKAIAFMLSAGLTSGMGALIAMRQISIEPTSMFGITWTMNMVVMSVVGGIGSIWGPFLGALVIYFGIEKQLEAYQDLATLATGLLLIAIVRFLPTGIVSALAQIPARFRNGQEKRSDPRLAPAQSPEGLAQSEARSS